MRRQDDREPETLEVVLAESNFVILACPLTPQTHHLIDRGRLQMMNARSWLINASRGAVVDEPALVAALRARRIAGAMLDVYERDRLHDADPLRTLDNVALTPHLAGSTVQSRRRMGEIVKNMDDRGVATPATSSQVLAKRIVDALDRWGKVVQEAKISIQ